MANNNTKKKKTKRYKDPHETLTLKYWLLGLVIVVAIIGLIVLLATLAARGDVVNFSDEGGYLVREGDNMMFLKASALYEVRYPLGNLYGEVTDQSGKKTKIYQVGFYDKYGQLQKMDDDNYLTDGVSLYYGSYAVLPELKSFETDVVRFGEESVNGDQTTIVYYSSLSNKDTAEATAFMQEYFAGKRYIGDGIPQKTYRVELTSSLYPHLACILYLVECDNGDYYLYSKDDPSSIEMDKTWFDSFYPEEEETTGQAPETTVPETTAPEKLS